MSSARRIRLFVVDDNPAVLRQVDQVLTVGYEVVETRMSGDGLVAAVDASDPDVVVLDITLPGENGLAVASRLARAGCRARIVFLTVHSDVDYVRSAIAVGATGYVVKARLAVDLPIALDAAFRGERFISPLPELRLD